MRPIPPQKKTNRVEKINSLIQHLLGGILLPYLKTQQGLTTIHKVETSKDLRWAKVWITILSGNEEKTLGVLRNNLYEIQGELNRLMEVKIVPRLSFKVDTTAQHAQHISEIFQKIEQERDSTDDHQQN